MLPELHALKEVQQLDMSVRELDRQLAHSPVEIAEVDAEIEQERDRLKAAEGAVEENGRARRRAEGELQDAESQVDKYQIQLLNAGSNIEYTGLLKQIATTREKIGEIEERIIILMDDGDQLAEDLERIGREFLEAERLLEARKHQLRAEAGERRQERERLMEQRGQTASGVPDGLFEQYERILRARHGLAVARVLESRCVACNVALRPQMYENVRVGAAVLNCESCGRILYFEPEARPSAE